MLKPFGITKFYTDNLPTYERHLSKDETIVSKYKMLPNWKKAFNIKNQNQKIAEENYLFLKNITNARFSDWTVSK